MLILSEIIVYFIGVVLLGLAVVFLGFSIRGIYRAIAIRNNLKKNKDEFEESNVREVF